MGRERILHSSGGRTPFIQMHYHYLLSRSCTHTLVSIKADVNEIKLKRERKLVDKEAKVKIEK